MDTEIILQGSTGLELTVSTPAPLSINLDGGLSGPKGDKGDKGADGSNGSGGGSSVYFNVEDYGAIGNGTADDTTSIQNAINAAHGEGGGGVYFPAGTFKLTAALTVYSHIQLIGAGDGPVDGTGGGGGLATTVIKQSSTTANAITGLNVYDFTVRDLTITGPSSGTGVGISLTRSTSGDCRYIHLEDITVQSFGSHGISIDLPIVSTFQGVIAYGNGGNGFNITATGGASSTSCAFISCWSHANTGIGWNINTMVYSTFVNCAADTNIAGGYLFTNSQGITLTSCGGEDNTGNCFKFTGCYNITGVAIWTYHNSSIAWYVTGNSVNVSLVGFHENTPTGTPTASIKVDTGSTATLTGYYVVTAVSLATGTTNVLSDAALNTTIQGQLNLPNTAKIVFGADSDLYRLAANSLATDGALTAYGRLTSATQVRGSDFELTNTSGSFAINATFNAGWKYISTGPAFLMAADGSGGAYYYTAPSGSAGAAITFTEQLHITTSGLKIASGAGANKVLTSDAAGNASWQTPAGGSGSSVGALTGIIVAASNAPSAWTTAATYTCDGTADNVEIQSAITAAKADGRRIYLSPGTFNIATTIALAGTDVTDANNVLFLHGQGAYQTTLIGATNVDLFQLSASVKVDMGDFLLTPKGTADGISSNASSVDPYRGFWDSSFKNILVRGLTDNSHTGWALNLGSPFRSTFENIEAYNVGNGIKLYSENAAFNPGDCTFTRCFMELNTNATGIGYYLSGGAAVMNHNVFSICEAFTYANTTTTIGLKLDGAVGSMWNRFIGTNLEQFGTVVDIVSGEGNEIDLNYVTYASGLAGTILKTEAGAYNNRVSCTFAYADHSGTLWSDANATPTQPNKFINSKAYADTGVTFTLSTLAGSIFYGNVSDGAGTTPAGWATNSLAGTSSVTASSTTTFTNKNLTSGTNTFPTFNQNTTGTAANVTGTVAIANGGTGVATLPTGILKGAGTGAITAVTAPAGAIVGTTDTQTLTAKRITKRVITATSSATPTPTGDTADIWYLSTLTVAATFAAPTGTPTDGQALRIRIKSVAAQTLAWNAIYLSSGVATLPTTSVAGKTITLDFQYDSAAVKWVLMAVDATGY